MIVPPFGVRPFAFSEKCNLRDVSELPGTSCEKIVTEAMRTILQAGGSPKSFAAGFEGVTLGTDIKSILA